MTVDPGNCRFGGLRAQCAGSFPHILPPTAAFRAEGPEAILVALCSVLRDRTATLSAVPKLLIRCRLPMSGRLYRQQQCFPFYNEPMTTERQGMQRGSESAIPGHSMAPCHPVK